MGKKRGGRGGGRSSRSSKSRSRSSGRSTSGASKSGGGKSSRGGRGTGRSTGSAGRGGSRSGSSGSRAKSWSSSQTGALGAAIKASQTANPLAWSKALSSDAGGISLKSFSTALDQGKEMSARPTKFTLKTTHITKEGGFDFKEASAAFFAATPFSILPSAEASPDKKVTESDSTNLGISVGDGYLVNGAGDMQDKAAQGLSNIAGMLDSDANQAVIQGWKDMQQKDAEGNTIISQGTWNHLQSLKGLDSTAPPPPGYVIGKTTVSGHADYMEKQVIRPIADVDPLGTWHYQYMQKFPDMYGVKSSEVGVQMPEGISTQLAKWQTIEQKYKETGAIPANPVTGLPQTADTIYRMLNLYSTLTRDIHYENVDGKMVPMHKPKHQAIQTGLTGAYTFGGTPARFNADGTRLIVSKADVTLAGQLKTNPDSLSAEQKIDAAKIQVKLDQSHYEFQKDAEGYVKYDGHYDADGKAIYHDPNHNLNTIGYDLFASATPKTVKRSEIVWGDNDEYLSGGGIIYQHETDAGIIESASLYVDKATGLAFTPAYDATSIDTSKYSIGEHQFVDRAASTVLGGTKGDPGVQPVGTVVSLQHINPETGNVNKALTSMEQAQLKLTHETGQDTFNPDGSLFATKKQPVVGSKSEWEQVGGSTSNLITGGDEYLRQKYTIGGGGGKKSVIPYWWGPREMISMVDTNEDGTPDMLQIAPWTDSTHPSMEGGSYVPPGGWGGAGGAGGEGAPGESYPRQPDPYEVPYYVDIGKAQEMLEAGMTIEDIMKRPPLMSDYMYWTDPTDKTEYVMSLTDYQEYLDAMKTQKQMTKQRKYDEVFMDVTRSSHRPNTQIKRRRSGASPAIGRRMASDAPSEADIGGLVK